MKETVKSAEWRVEEYQENDNTMQMTHAMTCAQHLELEPMSMCDIKRVCCETRENGTCEGVLFTHTVGAADCL